MAGFGAFLHKELLEVIRTWRIWVLPGIVLFFALTGPLTARFMPEILQALGPGDTGLVIEVPEPTYLHAYQQWAQNLTQIVTFALILALGGVVVAERRSGTAVLVLAKPLSRRAFILAKFLSQGLLVGFTTAAGALVTWAVTLAAFGEAPVGLLLAATGAWLVWGLLFVGIMVFFSSLVGAQAGAAGLGLAAFIGLSVLSVWGPAVRYSPVGLVGAPGDLVLGRGGPLFWPITTGLLLTLCAIVAAVAVFARKEL